MVIDFAVDYDDTYSAHPQLWDCILKNMRAAGMTVICATNRADTAANRLEIFGDLEGKVHDIVFCRGYKSRACREKGYLVAVWIDNDPRVDEPPAPLWWCKLAGAWQYVIKKLRGKS